ncbi:MAG TPA: response regulator [Phototrophicaceae bacterium]|nr:response regulator [Phototrophicaceae bacterium]
MTKILVIEDEPLILKNVADTLKLEGFDVQGVGNGRSGIEKAKEYQPNLVICDIMMPELDGFDVLIELRQNPITANIPFMFLTARTDRDSWRRGMELGADDYLMKPFTAEELLQAISRRIERYESVVHAYEQKLDALRANIIRALPHELRTPLTGIIGNTELLLMDYDHTERDLAVNMIESIQRSGMRLHRVIENYLTYAQIELMMDDPDMLAAARAARPIFAQPAICDIARQIAQQKCREDDLHLNVGEIEVRWFPENLSKMVEELVDNAFKFSKPGSLVKIQTSQDNQFAVLSISDQGRGIPPEHLNHIGAYMQFERMVHEQQGLGLGLIIAKRLAELHGGSLTIESQYGQGTTVQVKLPL